MNFWKNYQKYDGLYNQLMAIQLLHRKNSRQMLIHVANLVSKRCQFLLHIIIFRVMDEYIPYPYQHNNHQIDILFHISQHQFSIQQLEANYIVDDYIIQTVFPIFHPPIHPSITKFSNPDYVSPMYQNSAHMLEKSSILYAELRYHLVL